MTNRSAFLALVGFSEGADYGTIVTGIDGKPETFADFSEHPFEHRPAKQVARPSARYPRGLWSDASGRYQIILPTWHMLRQMLGLHDFTPASQDAAAIALIREHGALAHVDAGQLEDALRLCSGIWASLPGSTAGQPTHPYAVMQAKWDELIAQPEKEAA